MWPRYSCSTLLTAMACTSHFRLAGCSCVGNAWWIRWLSPHARRSVRLLIGQLSPKFRNGFRNQGGSRRKQMKMEAVVWPTESLNRARTARQGIMGPFNLAWKTWVILAGGFAPDQHSDSNFVHVCLSANPPIEIYPRLCHSSQVLAAQGGVGTCLLSTPEAAERI